MEIRVGPWNNDCNSFVRVWFTVLLSLHVQFDSVASCPKECRCDKTFIYCNERSLTSVPLGIGEGYKILYLHNNQINSAGFPTELHNVASVDTVYLYGNQLDEFPLNLPKNVKILHLQENNIQTISRAALAQLPQLEELHLDDNSISTVGVEEGAFREAVNLKLLFLTKNHLSSVPIGLPADLKELRLDENRIAEIDGGAFRNVTNLQRLLLDGNLLEDNAIAPGTFRNLVNLKELSLSRNSLTRPPPLLPSVSLAKLNLQENQMKDIPALVFSELRKLEKLDLSTNLLQTVPQGVFDGLSSLTHLNVRGNHWNCDCAIKRIIFWLKSISSSVNVRGIMAHSLISISNTSSWNHHPPQNHLYHHHVIHSFLPNHNRFTPPVPNFPPAPYPPYEDPLKISLNVVNGTCVEVSWESYFTVTAYKVTWVKRSQNLMMDISQERTVPGEQRRLNLYDLEPRSKYRICVYILDSLNSYRPGEDTICSEIRTKSSSRHTNNPSESDQGAQQDVTSTFLLAGVIGGIVLLVLIVLLGLFCWYMHKKSRSSCSSSKWKYNRGRRKDDYCEAGTKKDNSILEMTETSFQVVPLNNEQLLKGDFRIQPIYTPNVGIGSESSGGHQTVGIRRTMTWFCSRVSGTDVFYVVSLLSASDIKLPERNRTGTDALISMKSLSRDNIVTGPHIHIERSPSLTEGSASQLVQRFHVSDKQQSTEHRAGGGARDVSSGFSADEVVKPAAQLFYNIQTTTDLRLFRVTIQRRDPDKYVKIERYSVSRKRPCLSGM
ncbi:Leucine-rich repeat transmembrane protein FLRT2 [Bagarius yarrelli]|uniref:Leucine-rich repeat transmembrane protein FLRT2 n=1 Tax=Bagarius yarrelli TaxID=175774 RepID=A0A556VCG7_BAGYA|nr:Leucine-rich repeat transmembrane protein FLRT2 [Bagarius yarrelli]